MFNPCPISQNKKELKLKLVWPGTKFEFEILQDIDGSVDVYCRTLGTLLHGNSNMLRIKYDATMQQSSMN